MKLFATLLFTALAAKVAHAMPNIVQTYYVPLREDDLFDTFKTINTGRVSEPITTTISVAIASSGTIVYYDHWEDGYDAQANAPAGGPFATTRVWGDNDPSNGMPPGYTVDILEGGDVITLTDIIDIPRNALNFFFDGGDRISANLPIAVTRSAFPQQPGSLMAGAIEVFNQDDWGREFIAPVSMTNSTPSDPWEYAVFYVMAGDDQTQVSINGALTYTLQAGDNVVISLNQGDLITATRPIQVDFLAGDINSNFELRWYAQTEVREWTSEYYSPVAETVGNTGYWFYNPNPPSMGLLEIFWEGHNVANPGSSITVPSGNFVFIECVEASSSVTTPAIRIVDSGPGADTEGGAHYTGLRFFTAPPSGGGAAPVFYGFVQIDANGAGELFDWGFPLLPSETLTSTALVGRGDGCNGPCGSGGERSVVWITPVDDTYIFIDYDGDGSFDENFAMDKLASRRIIDTINNDEDMTGAIIASSTSRTNSTMKADPAGTPVPIAVAWGQDPQRSGPNDGKALDLGTVVLPLANPFVSKNVIAVVNPDGSVDPFSVVDQTGDIIVYEITVSNVGFAELNDVVVVDPLLGAGLVGPTESGTVDSVLAKGETFTYTGNYTVTSTDIATMGGGDQNIENSATVTTSSPFPPVTVSTETPIFLSTIAGNVTEDIDNDNLGDVPIPGVQIELRDASGNTVATTLTDAQGTYQFDNVEAGQYTVIQTNLDATYSDVSDADGGPDLNVIAVTLLGGDLTNGGNNFVDERQGSISGTVKDDNGNAIPGVVLELQSDGTTVMTTITTGTGSYIFENVGPQNYTVVEPDLPNYPTSLSDQDNTNDGDAGDTDTTVDNTIAVTLNPAENDDGNDFVDSDNGSISGSVKDDLGNALAGVSVTLNYPNGTQVTILTNVDGSYLFEDLEPGAYTVTEVNPPGFPGNISDRDETPEAGEDADTLVDDSIPVLLTPGENDDGNNFVDELRRGSIGGMVSEDINNDNDGDVPIEGVLITLLAADGTTVVATTLTDATGNYNFPNIDDGSYFVAQTNLDSTYTDVSDSDGGPNLGLIAVTISNGDGAPGNNFVDERPGTITGHVRDDDENRISGVVITLFDTNSALLATTASDSNGDYAFTGVPPGNYTVSEESLAAFPIDIADLDEFEDGDAADTDTTVDNMIGVMLEPAETDEGNNFVDSAKGTIGGNVTNNSGDPIPNVLITLTETGSNTVIGTTLTAADGSFTFEMVPPGDYILTEENSPLFPDDVRDEDLSPDGDAGELDTGGPNNQIGVTITPGESDVDNSFVDTIFGSISGAALEDINNDDVGDNGIPGVLITLFEADGITVVATTLTDGTGSYSFEQIEDGSYIIEQTNLDDTYTDVTDADGGNPNRISLTVVNGTVTTGNNFIDERPGNITGTAKDDEGNPIGDVLITLKDDMGATDATTRTDSSGFYIFTGVEPGNYTVEQEVIAQFPTSVSDQDDTNDGDATDDDTTVDNKIGVTITPAEEDNGNNFVDSNRGRISGFVTDDGGAPIKDVPITLLDEDGTTILGTTLTDSNGEYFFEGLVPGNYTLTETNLPQYTGDLSDGDATPDGDIGDSDTTPDNIIKVTLGVAEMDNGNNFVDILQSSAPSMTPAPPPEFCKDIPDDNCDHCIPFRSPDYCNASVSFPALLQSRTSQFRNNATGLFDDDWWFHLVEDKVAAHLLSASQGVPSPQIFCCETDVADLAACLLAEVTSTGIVIKATDFHSNQGVFVLTNFSSDAINNPLEPYMFDVINDVSIAYGDVIASMSFMGATKIIVEEFIGTQLPTEYKFHVVNGTVAAIDIITDRGQECPCYAVIDTAGVRLDKYGCFEPGGYGMTDASGCTVIDFTSGDIKAGPVKKDLYICEDIPDIAPCLLDAMTATALSLGNTIGVYMRVDMFVAGGKYYVQEYTPNHMNGQRHCAATLEDDGCINSCFLGELYDAAGAPFGGSRTPVPTMLDNYLGLTPTAQCALLNGVTVAPAGQCATP